MARKRLIDFKLEPNENAGANSADNSNAPTVEGPNITDSGLPTESGNSTVAIDPETVTAGDSSTSTRTNTKPNTRTRAAASSRESRKSANTANAAKRAEQSAQATENLAVSFHSLHFGLFMLTKCPEVCISTEEAEKWADAVNRVNQQFETSIISPKATALFNFAIVTGGIYVPRIIAFKNRKAKESKQQNQSGNVVAIAGMPTEVKPN